MANFWDRVTQRDLQASFDPVLLTRAVRLVQINSVEDLEMDKDGTLSGIVTEGRELYRASVAPRKDLLNMLCECGGLNDGPCVHVLALMVAWVGVGDLGEVGEEEVLIGGHAANPRPAAPQTHTALFPTAGLEEIRADWLKRFEGLTVNEMRSLASARGVKLKGTLRDQVSQGLLHALEDPRALTASLENLHADARRVLDLYCILKGASPDFGPGHIMPYLTAAIDSGQKARSLQDCLAELKTTGLYIEPSFTNFYPVPLQVMVHLAPDPTLFKPFSGQPQRIAPAHPFEYARLVLRLLLLAQGGRLHCAPRPGVKNNAWPVPPEADKGASEIEIFPEPAYLETGLRGGLARGLGLSEAQVDLAARQLEAEHFWPQRAPEKLSERLNTWLLLTPQDQSRQLFLQALTFLGQVELDLARKGGFTPWRSPAAGLSYKAFLQSLAQARLRLARLVALIPSGQWVEIDSILRIVHALQPGWGMEFYSRQADPYSARVWQNAPAWASIGRKRVDPLAYDDWRKTIGQFHLAMLTGSLAWLGLVDVGWQGDLPVAVRLAEFGEFLIGRRADFPLPPPPTHASALVVRSDWAIELDLDTAPLDLINLLLRIAVPDAEQGKHESRKLVYRINELGMGRAFENGWTLEQIVSRLEAAAGVPLPRELVERMLPFWEHFGRLQIYEDMTLIEFADDFCLPELLAGTRLSQILVTTFSPRLVAVRTDAAADFIAELQSKGYTPHSEGVQNG